MGRVILFSIAIANLGCDPVRTTTQEAVLRIIDRESSSPIPDAIVEIKPAWLPEYPAHPEMDRMKNEQWEQSKWLQATSDSEGMARFPIVKTVLDGTRGNAPPPNTRDITGRSYLARLVVNGIATEELEITLKSNLQVESNEYRLEVVTISAVRYVQ